MINPQIELPMEQIIAFCERHPIRRLSLFGSILREDFRPDSDVDVLVEFVPDTPMTYFDLIGMQLELQKIVERNVDLLEKSEIKRQFRQEVIDSAVTIYERA